MKQKLDNAYKTIGEVAKALDLVNPKNGKLNTHTIRFWEKNSNKLNLKYLQEKEDTMIKKQ